MKKKKKAGYTLLKSFKHLVEVREVGKATGYKLKVKLKKLLKKK